jgi:hypothetical protein
VQSGAAEPSGFARSLPARMRAMRRCPLSLLRQNSAKDAITALKEIGMELSSEQYDFLVHTTNARGAVFDPAYHYVQYILGGSERSHYWLYLKVGTLLGEAASTRKSPRDWLQDQKAFEALIDDCLDHIEKAIAN